jgi:hypothetical protein
MLATILFRDFCLPVSSVISLGLKYTKFYLFVCWSLTLRDEHRLKMFENRVLRRTFGPKREEVAGVWRRLHNEELHNLYASPNIIRVIILRRMGLAGHVAHVGEMRNAYNIFVGRPEGKRPFGSSSVGWRIILEWILGK